MKIDQKTKVSLTRATCPLCKEETDLVLASELRRGSGVVYYCRSCQHGFLEQKETIDSKKYYAEEYRQEYSHNAEAAATNAREIFDVYRNYQHERLLAIKPFLDTTTKLLEVGASSGQFISHILGEVAQISAIELDKACCDFLTNELSIDTDSEFLRDSKFANDVYDVVCSFQVMEHVEEPVTFLNDLRQSTKTGGTIFVEVPNLHDPLLTVWDIKSYQKFFYHSAHLQYFTETSLRKVAEDAGFLSDEIEISFTQDYNLLKHLHWIMNDGPQANCHIGFSEIALHGDDKEISSWLTHEMQKLNKQYIEKLISAKSTSNIMMRLTNGK